MSVLIETLVVALVGGSLFYFINMPLPWMIGSVTGVMVWKHVVRRPVRWPLMVRNAGLTVIGYMMGISFTMDMMQQIYQQIPAMMLVTLATILISMLLGYLTHRVTKISLSSAIIGSVPGGLSQMIILSEEVFDADMTVVAFMQTMRLLSTVFIIPFLVMHGVAGPTVQGGEVVSAVDQNLISRPIWIPVLFLVVVILSTRAAIKVNLPTPYLLGPLCGTAVLVLVGVPGIKPPYLVTVFSQLAIGAFIGTNINSAGIKNGKKFFFFTLIGCIILISLSLLMGVLLNRFHGMSLIDAFLSIAPGGMAEMGLTALIVQGNVSLVSAYQLFRVIFILVFMPPLLRRWLSGKLVQKERD